ncbi:MAG: PD40 domain-containing protein [Chloroflexi bacterium]|nr:PD40 domain-containing protein [Chloroflexota bacterium]
MRTFSYIALVLILFLSLAHFLSLALGLDSPLGMVAEWLGERIERETDPAKLFILVSVGHGGAPADDGSHAACLSGDGQWLAFASLASNLIDPRLEPADTNGHGDVFLYARDTGRVQRISLTLLGQEANGTSRSPSLAHDGRRVAFESDANNLMLGDANGASDVFVYDLTGGEMWWASVSAENIPGNLSSYMPSLSADGRVVAFESDASNLVPGDTNDARDIFIRDLGSSTIQRVSVSSDGQEGDGFSIGASLSADGQLVVFASSARNLTPDDGDPIGDIFVHDRISGQTKLISVSSERIKGDRPSGAPMISADGRYVVFESLATNLVPGDTNGTSDIFIHDLGRRTTTRVSISTEGLQANGDSYLADISADGRYVAFESTASNLTADADRETTNIYWRDLQTGRTVCISAGAKNALVDEPAKGWANGVTLSADGHWVAFSLMLEPMNPTRPMPPKTILLRMVPKA